MEGGTLLLRQSADSEGACLPQAGRWSWAEEVTRPTDGGAREVRIRLSTKETNPFGFFSFVRITHKNKFLLACSKIKNPGEYRDWFLLWSWRELNPRPDKETICFLHA